MKMITERLKFADIFPDRAAEVAQRLHIKKDEIPFVRKYYTAEKDKTEIKKKERAIISYISTGIKDRDGEKLLPEGVLLENYQKNPIVPFAHDYRSLPPAKNMWIKADEKGLIAKTVFAKNQRAEDICQAYTEDIEGTGPLLNAFSVGFIPLEWEDTDKKALEKDPNLPKRIYNKWELLEYSLVPIPSCPEALTIAVEKNLIPETLKKDLEIVVVKEKKDREIEITMEDIKDKPIFEKKIKDKFVKEMSGDLKKHLDEQEEKFIHGDKEIVVEKDEEIITKPETTENYHRIPVESPDKHKEHRIRTITISAAKGIKALYCGQCKKVITYLFDVNKWTMAEAQTWVSEHKREIEEYLQKYLTREVAEKEEYKEMIESMSFIRFVPSKEKADKEFFKETEAKKPQYKERWNKSLSKLFDVASTQSPKPLRFHYELYEKFLECKVKEIFQNGYVIPGPLLGTYLAGLKEILGEFGLKDTRKFTWDGSEVPPDNEVIQLNSEKSDDFLIDGMCFYEAEKKPLIVNFSPNWSGLTVTLTTSNENKEWNKELLDKVHSWVHENNFLRGEKFSLSGDFLHEPDDDWNNLILDEKYKDSIRKSASFLEKKGKGFTGRGLLFIGPPGTGKTKTGRVLMNELDATFIWVSSKDFRHIGPLRALVLGFSLARDLAPSVLFLEDIDTWLSGDMEFVTDLIKTEMDGIKQNRGIITILTSNYPEKLPDALLDRPGRFHHIVNFELPKAEQRKEMLKLWAGEMADELLTELVAKTDGFSGAHMKELVEFARMISEEEEIDIGKALIMSLDKLTEQRELIEEIRENKVNAKATWYRVKYIKGEIKIAGDKSIEIEKEDEPEIEKEEEQGYVFAKKKNVQSMIDELERNWDKLLKQKDEIIAEKDEIIADLKEGRVLSRKNRGIVKDAITALDVLLKADAAGSTEDEESETGTVTERDIEVVKDGEREFSKEDITKVVKEISGKQMGEVLEEAFKKALDPEKIKVMIGESIGLELKKLQGKVE